LAYVGNGSSSYSHFDFWSYNPATNEWIQVADFNDERGKTGAFELNGYGYVTGGYTFISLADCWRYDPSLNSWSKEENIGHRPISDHFSFSLDGKGYVGGGSGYGRFEFYEFIP
jgi:N-acetylneuraminic acid mutarotase